MEQEEYPFPFEKLRVWQQTRKWTLSVQKIVSGFPSEEKYNLSSQLNRASVSVASNLAEGTTRMSTKDQAHFSNIAYASLMECACLLLLCLDRELITEEILKTQRTEIASIANQINALRKSQLK